MSWKVEYELRLEDKLRKKAFAHYDCRSITVDFKRPNRYRSLEQRRNTITELPTIQQQQAPTKYQQDQPQQQQQNHQQQNNNQTTNNSQTTNNINNSNSNNNNNNDGNSDDITVGVNLADCRENQLVANCLQRYKNEIGGEEERIICLNRLTTRPQHTEYELHRPAFASGISILEDAQDPNINRYCPYQKCVPDDHIFAIDYVDTGANYYRRYFYGTDHQNWFGRSEKCGPLAISIKKERISNNNSNNININNNHINNFYININGNNKGTFSSIHNNQKQPSHHFSTQSLHNTPQNHESNQNHIGKFQYRIIIRTSELEVLRGSVYEDCIPTLTSNHNNSSSSRSSNQNTTNHNAKEVLEYLLADTDIPLLKLRLGTPNADEKLLKLDEVNKELTETYKVGILYCKAGQSTEEESYNNEHSGPLLEEFLACLGERVRLKGFDRYRGGLDTKKDTTGLHSVYATYGNCEIMFHVSTLLPFEPNNRQQISRKRHIGNNIVTIVFQEEGALPFRAGDIRSDFQHVFIIVRALNTPLLPDGTLDMNAPRHYAVAVSRRKEIPLFGPPIPEGGIFVKSRLFTNFILAKIINAENAVHRYVEIFSTMARRTRLGHLTDLTEHYITNTSLNDLSGGSTSAAGAVKIVSSIFGGKKRSTKRYANYCGHSAIKGAIVWEVQVDDFGQSQKIDCLLGISSSYLIIIEERTKETIYVTPVEAVLGWTSLSNWIKIYCHQGECLLLSCKDSDLDEIPEIITRLKAVTNGCEASQLILNRRKENSSLGFDIQQDGIVTKVAPASIAWQANLKPGSRLVEICTVAISTMNYAQIMDYIKTSALLPISVLPPNLDGSPRIGCFGYVCINHATIPRPPSTFSTSSNTYFAKPRRRGTNLITLV